MAVHSKSFVASLKRPSNVPQTFPDKKLVKISRSWFFRNVEGRRLIRAYINLYLCIGNLFSAPLSQKKHVRTNIKTKACPNLPV